LLVLVILSKTETTSKSLLTSTELAKKRSKFKRKALLIGVNQYADPGNNLNGCLNDVMDVRNTLQILGFPVTRIHILTDQRATKANIMKELEWLVKDAKKDDVLVFYYSGHGSYVTDIDMDEDEVRNKVDEVILPHDFDFYQRTYITDDELHSVFTGKTPAGVRCEVLLDCCHAGTATRSLLRHSTGNGNNAVGRFVPPPVEYQAIFNSQIPGETEFDYISGRGVESKSAKTQHNISWYACQDFQVSWEMYVGNEIRGVFTHALMEIFRRSSGNQKTRLEVFQLLRHQMSVRRYEQIPGLDVAMEESKHQYPFRRPFEDESSEVAPTFSTQA